MGVTIRYRYFQRWRRRSYPSFKVRIAIITNNHDDTPHAILTLLVVPAGKYVNL